MVKSALACVAAATVFTAVTAPEAKPDEEVGLSLLADAAHTGVIGVHVRSAPSTQVTLGEIVAGRRHPLKTVTSPAEYWDVAELTHWRCDRQVRRFYATTELTTGELASATSAVRTPSCRKRLVLHLPEQARPGRPAKFVVRDRWRIGGVAGKVCLAGPWEALRCHTFRIRRSRRSTALRVHLGWTGPWRVELRGPDQRRRLRARRGAPCFSPASSSAAPESVLHGRLDDGEPRHDRPRPAPRTRTCQQCAAFRNRSLETRIRLDQSSATRRPQSSPARSCGLSGGRRGICDKRPQGRTRSRAAVRTGSSSMRGASARSSMDMPPASSGSRNRPRAPPTGPRSTGP